MTNWTFPLGAPADVRRELPVFALTPNWKTGVLERLEWLTNILISERAVEQRRSLRRYPRRSFEASFLRADTQRARLDMFRTGVAHEIMLVPLWHEQFKLGDGRVDGLVQFPAGSLAKREFRLGDLVLASTGDPNVTSVLTVMDVDLIADTITLASVVNEGPWPPGTRITPLRRARVLEPASITNHTDRAGAVSLRFELSDADTSFTPEWGWYTPLFRFKPDRSTPVSVDHYRQNYILDNSIGPISVVDPSNRAQISTSMALKLYGRDEVFAFRQFLYAARGKAVRFWVPSGQSDLLLNAPTGGTTFTTQVSGFYDYMEGPQDARKVIKITLKDGLAPFYRTITAVEPVLSLVAPFRPVAERFTVDKPLPTIVLSQIERVSFMVPSRFDQDGFELYHPVDGSKGVTAQVVTRSSTLAGLPPLEMHVTSMPYPGMDGDSLNASASLIGGQLRIGIYGPEVESLDASPSLVDGTLRALLQTYTADEALDTTPALVEGSLRVLLQSYDAGFEALDSTPALTSGVLKVALISYDSKFEALDTSPSLIGGTLV